MKDFHEDEDTRLEDERCAGIVVRDGKLLLIHRIKKGYEYYVFPGGHRRKGESSEDACVREVLEETAIETRNPELVFTFQDHRGGWLHKYFICEWKEGDKPHLNGEEAVRQCEENQFYPEWVGLDRIEELNVLPKFAKEWFFEDFNIRE